MCNRRRVGRLGDHLGRSLAAYRLAFANRNLRRMQLAGVGSLIGNWAYGVALVVYAFDQGGATAVGIVALLRFLPSAFVSPFTAILGDRLPRLRLMLSSDLLRAAAMFGMAIVAAVDGPAAVVYGLAVAATLVATAYVPAERAVLPKLAETPEELTAANVVTSTVDSISSFLGPALGGLLLAATSTSAVFAVNGLTFLWSGALIALIVRSTPDPRPSVIDAGPARNPFADLFAGVALVARQPGPRFVVLLTAAQTLVYGALTVLTVVLALELLDIGEAGIGLLNSAVGIGGLLASLAAFSLIGRGGLGTVFAIGVALWGIPLILVGAWPEVALVFFLYAVIGAANTLVDVAGLTILQRSVDDAIRARVFGVLQTLIILGIAIGAATAPVLIELAGAETAFIVTGALLPVLVALTWKQLRALDAVAAAPDLALLSSIPLFAPLAGTALERLAANLDDVRVDAGSVVIRQGDPGDRFYVVKAGELEVTVDGGAPRPMGRGDFFGEIALIRDVPRTATVTARTDCELGALERTEFLAAVTGFGAAIEAAEAVVATRLEPGVPGPSSVATT
jgi:MFS family permease